MTTFADRFKKLHQSGPNMQGIFDTGRDLTTAIQSRFGLTEHGKKAIHDVLCALEECQAAESEKIDAHLERERAAQAVKDAETEPKQAAE